MRHLDTLWKRLPFAVLAAAALTTAAMDESARAAAVNYDIVYVRWPRDGSNLVMLPQGEDPYRARAGADLVMLHPDGSQRVLVDCVSCCVQDPMVSFDGEWVYYTKMLDAGNVRSPSLLFKMHIAGAGADFSEVELTFNDGFDGWLHQGNDSASDDLAQYFSIRDMGPAPLPGGKIAFTSNRHAVIPFRQGTHFNMTDASQLPVMQIYVMDDHDGRMTTAELANLRQVGFGNLHMALHPTVLQDGRILFTNWDDAGAKFFYAMSTLYAMNPDGSHLVAITEPHDHHKNVDHFATQLGSGAIVAGQYYPTYNFGFGHLLRFPINPGLPAYTKAPSPVKNTFNGYPVSFRNFDNVGLVSLTPHTSGEDCVAPNRSGKYAMPCAAPLGTCLVAYSPGGVNHNSSCTGTNPEVLDSGIYLIVNAETGLVTDPTSSSQLVKLLNSPDYNEIWPRPVVSYEEVHGVPEPRTIPPTDSLRPADDRLEPAEPHAIVGTSSLYNRESTQLGGDPFRSPTGRELHTGTWMIQGTDTGVVKSSDIWGVRIIGVVPKPFRTPISRWSGSEFSAVVNYLADSRADSFVEGYASSHSERWKILGEFPVRKYDDSGNPVLDARGDPDTSFAAKIPADTPFFYQGIDRNGMTLFSELTWRSVAAGEVRTDCGGCHAHSILPLDFAGTAADRRLPIKATGITSADPLISTGLWDLTQKTPLITSLADGTPSVRTVAGGLADVEFYRDVKTVLDRRCVSCHKTSGNTTGTDLAFDGTTATDSAYFRLVQDALGKFGGAGPGGSYVYPQLTRYVRANQARQSLLVWELFGQRLDGRQNSDRTDDLDFTPHSVPHGATIEECRTIARWIDLGCPIDFTSAAHAGYRYTDDDSLPVINIGTPGRGANAAGSFDGVIRIGVADAEGVIDWNTLEVALDQDLSDGVNPVPLSLASLSRPSYSHVAYLTLPAALSLNREMLLVTTIADASGNRGRDARLFWITDGGGTAPEGVPPRPATAPPPPVEEPPTVATNDPVSGSGPTSTDGSTPSGTSGTSSGGSSGTVTSVSGGGGGGCAASRREDPSLLAVILIPAAVALFHRRRRQRA